MFSAQSNYNVFDKFKVVVLVLVLELKSCNWPNFYAYR